MITDNIFKILKEQKMSQKDFSKATGIAESTISDWKHKGNVPSADKIMDICKVLNVSPYELLEDESDSTDYVTVDKTTDLGILIEVYSNMSKEQQSRLLGYAQGLSNN